MTPVTKKIGVLGAGQLGRMLAISGYPLGHKFGFYGYSKDEPSALLGHIFEHSDETDSLNELIKFADVITYESENTNIEQIRKISQYVPVFPGEKSLYISQHRGREKYLFEKLSIPVTPYKVINSLEELKIAIEDIGLPSVLKTTTEGYDGKGQYIIKKKNQTEDAWNKIGNRELILEKFVKFKRELSIIAVRNEKNEHRFYPLTHNVHHEGILRYSIAPAQETSSNLQQQAQDYICRILDNLNHVGALTLELFDTENGLIANEIAPRVHNSGHWTIDATQTNQFENHIRAITGVPLGTTKQYSAVSLMINIIGKTGDITMVLEHPYASIHLYDKEEREGRKLGHINITLENIKQLDAMLHKFQNFLP